MGLLSIRPWVTRLSSQGWTKQEIKHIWSSQWLSNRVIQLETNIENKGNGLSVRLMLFIHGCYSSSQAQCYLKTSMKSCTFKASDEHTCVCWGGYKSALWHFCMGEYVFFTSSLSTGTTTVTTLINCLSLGLSLIRLRICCLLFARVLQDIFLACFSTVDQ